MSFSYTIERELGGGGMSLVFLAEERALGRKVVVKVLPPDLVAGVNADRFNREIQVAAKLQQAQIVPVLSAGEIDGIPYYTMPFVEGESLRTRLARQGALPIAQVINVLRDVTRALAYAHAQGVVHRDIKPDNVLLSGGTAVVTDFGIAKAISAARTRSNEPALTQIGTSIGTPAYMSPEQAAGDPNVDHRADIYSLGCLAFELLTGQPPFAGRTPQRTLAAHLTEAPPPIETLRSDAPAALVALVTQCLEKDPALRPQTAEEIAARLDAISTGSTATSGLPLPAPGAIRRALLLYAVAFVIVALVAKGLVIAVGLPDWVFSGAVILVAACLPLMLATAYTHYTARASLSTSPPALTPNGSPVSPNAMTALALKAHPHLTWRRAFRAGGLAVAGFAVVVISIMVLRFFGIGPVASLLAAGTLHGRERLLVADFATGRDTSLSHLLTEALRTDLGQSKAVSIMPPSAVAAALTRMQRPPLTPVDVPLGREIAQREGVKAVVGGSLTPLGSGYAVSVRLVAADSGNELAAFRKTVDAPSQLLDAIDDLTRKLRGRIGESLKTVRDAPALDEVTTSSLDALRLYAEASRAFDLQADYIKAASILREAVAKDTTFAMAYRKLGIALSNAGMPHAQVDSALARAYRYSARLPEKERYVAIGSYYQNGPGRDRQKASAAFERALSVDPLDPAALNNLANLRRSLRQFARAESLYQVLVVSPRAAQVSFGNYVGALFVDGKLAEAESVHAEWRQRFPKSSTMLTYPPLFMYARGQLDSAESYWRGLLHDENVGLQVSALTNLAEFALLHGKVRTGDSLLRASQALNERRGFQRNRFAEDVAAGFASIWYLGRNDEGVRMLDEAVSKTSLRTLPVEERQYHNLALYYAMAGRVDKARAILGQFNADVQDSALRVIYSPAEHWVLGEIALTEKRPLDAVREFAKSDSLPDGPDGDCYFCKQVLIARAYERAGVVDSAIVNYERYLAGRFAARLSLDAQYAPYVHEHLGALYEAKGNTERAARHYATFVDLWKNADPALQPRVAAARQRLARLNQVASR